MGVRSFLGWLRRTLNDARCSCHFEAGDASCAVEWEKVALYVDLNGYGSPCTHRYSSAGMRRCTCLQMS